MSLPLLTLFSLVGCTNSGLGRPTPVDTGEGSGQNDGKGKGNNKNNCPFVGEWELDSINCSTFPYDAWYDIVETATLEIDHADDGGCTIVSTLEGQDCEQVEEWSLTKPVGTDADVTYEGISSCDPESCSFDPKISDCEEGGRTGEDTLSIDDATGDLTIDGLFIDFAYGCPLSVVTVWKKQ